MNLQSLISKGFITLEANFHIKIQRFQEISFGGLQVSNVINSSCASHPMCLRYIIIYKIIAGVAAQVDLQKRFSHLFNQLRNAFVSCFTTLFFSAVGVRETVFVNFKVNPYIGKTNCPPSWYFLNELNVALSLCQLFVREICINRG